jgi:hypothetical protein
MVISFSAQTKTEERQGDAHEGKDNKFHDDRQKVTEVSQIVCAQTKKKYLCCECTIQRKMTVNNGASRPRGKCFCFV